MKIALFIANRGFFPSVVLESAREDMRAAANNCHIDLLELDPSLTRFGAVETAKEGAVYANFLEAHRGEYDGVILCLPNFGDENGIKAALKDTEVPVLLQAYPDEIGKMDFSRRRDAFCGKLGLTSVFKQMDFKYTSGLPFVMHPASIEFEKELKDFISICRIVKRMRSMRLGVFGARTSAFKSVRYDEIAMERLGIEVEALDLTMLFDRYMDIQESDPKVKDWIDKLYETADFSDVPDGINKALGRLGVTFESFIQEMELDAIAVRCWIELEEKLRIAPCAVMGVLNQMGIPAACETDATNAVAMLALMLAAGRPSGCLDLNNNYGSELDKCVLFHCGPLPLDLMTGPGHIEEHKMFVKTMGNNCSWGLNVGKLKPGDITISGMRTDHGKVEYYVENALITDDLVEPNFFGTKGVMFLEGLQSKLKNLSEAGFRHHAIITRGHHERAVSEALSKYLGYKRIML